MKETLRQLLGVESEESRRIQRIETKGLIGSHKLTYRRIDGSLREQYALDVIFNGGLSEWFIDQLRSMEIKDLILPALLDGYGSYVPRQGRHVFDLDLNTLVERAFGWLQ